MPSLMPLNVRRLAMRLYELPDDVVAVSFDVFNTLIERVVEPPDVTKRPAAHALREMCNGRFPVQSLIESRLQVECRLASTTRNAGKDAEFGIEQLLRHWAGLWLGRCIAADELERLLQVEMACERDLSRRVEGIEDVLQQVHSTGRRLYFLSDMYLGTSRIRELLGHLGLADYFIDGLCSCDPGLGKRSGRLFHYALSSWRLLPRQMAHVGDDFHADVRMPQRVGMRAFWFRDGSRDQRLQNAKSAIRLSRRHPEGRGIHFVQQVIGYADARYERSRSPYYRIGLEVIGPLLMNFVHRLALLARRDGIDLLMFVAREGFVLGELYRRLRAAQHPSLGGLPDSNYAFVSRKSAYTAAIAGLGEWEKAVGAFTPEPTIGKFIDRLSIRHLLPDGLLASCGFVDLDEALDPQDARLQRVFDDSEFRKRLEDQRLNATALLQGYLRQIGVFDAEHPALVDLGWYGTSQAAINRSMSGFADWPGLRGYYLAMWQHDVLREPLNPRVTAVLYDEARQESRCPIARFPELLELATRAPHATTIGYEYTDGRFEPVCRSDEHPARQAELADRAYVSGLQAGLFDYADAYIALLGIRDQPAVADTGYVMQRFDRLVRHPGRGEAEALLAFEHSEDVGRGLVRQAKTLTDLRDGRRVLWPEGFWRNAGGPLGGLAYNAFRMFARRYY